MRYSRFPKLSRRDPAPSKARLTAARKALQRERDKAPLFAEEIAAEQPTPEERIERVEDAPGIAIYCDPPYFLETRGANHGSSKYVHDFAYEDHRRLADALRRFHRARVVVSYYEHPELEWIYRGWTQRKIEVSKAMASQGRRVANDVRAIEVLLLNGPSYAKPEALSLF